MIEQSNKFDKYWKSLIVNWRIKRGKKGLTIPFIIGAQDFLNKENEKHDINGLINDITLDGEYEIYITYCPDLNAQILCLRDESKKNIKGFFPSYMGKKQDNFFRTISISDDQDETVEDIIQELISQNQKNIDDGEFSFQIYRKNEPCRFPFDPDDIEFIEQCYKELDTK